MRSLPQFLVCAALGCAGAASAHAAELSTPAPITVAQLCADEISAAGFEAATHHCSANGTTMIYTDRAAFLDALEVGHIDNAFDEVTAGPSGELHFDEDGFQYRIVTQFGADGLLYNGDGFVSTERSRDAVELFIVPFTRPVTAIGADFFTTDLSVTPAAGTVHLLLDDVEDTFESTGAPTFRGFVGDLGFTGWDEFATGASDGGAPTDRWPAMDNLLLGVHR